MPKYHNDPAMQKNIERALDISRKLYQLVEARNVTKNSGLDAAMMKAGIELTGYYIESGVRTFDACSEKIIADLGKAARPYLKAWYLAVRNWPDFDNAGMNSEAELDKFSEQVVKVSREPRPTMPNAQNLLKPETLEALSKMGNHAQVVAERWVSGWKGQTLAMEKDGTLLDLIKDRATTEADILATAKMGGENNHLARHEIMEMYDLKPGP